mmetsp:Transcript_23943/g.26454  ORF Transcript_23943/g.26454 Transcript_23943/m.26454 type:complete len:80 (+) Transcript_23943:107-346(+)
MQASSKHHLSMNRRETFRSTRNESFDDESNNFSRRPMTRTKGLSYIDDVVSKTNMDRMKITNSLSTVWSTSGDSSLYSQ